MISVRHTCTIDTLSSGVNDPGKTVVSIYDGSAVVNILSMLAIGICLAFPQGLLQSRRPII